MRFILHAARFTPNGASRLVQAMSAWSVKTRRAPSRHCRGSVILRTTAIHDTTTRPPPAPCTVLHAWSAKCLPDRSKPDALRPGTAGMRRSLVLRTTFMHDTISSAPAPTGLRPPVQLALWTSSRFHAKNGAQSSWDTIGARVLTPLFPIGCRALARVVLCASWAVECVTSKAAAMIGDIGML